MDGNAVEQLREGFAKPMQFDDVLALPAGWTTKDTTAVIEAGPKAGTLQVNSLGAIRDYIKANRDALKLDRLVVHVATPRIVKILGPLDERTRTRETFVEATVPDMSEQFLGQFHQHEAFIIGLQTRFADADQWKDVLRLLSGIKGEQVKQSMDDGISQVVTTRTGNVLVGEVNVPNPVLLAPYRTFRDTVQPSSLFVLRVQGGKEGSMPTIGLFEADGGAWRLVAVERVRNWLTDALPADVHVLA